METVSTLIRQRIADLAPAPVFAVRPVDVSGGRGILLRSPNWLGDAVMTLPALKQLRMLLKEGQRLMVIAPPGLKDFFQALPLVDDVLTPEAAHRRWSRTFRARLVALQPSLTVMFTNSLRDVLQLRLAGISRIYGAKARGRSWLLERSFAFPPRRSGELNALHHANKYLAMVAALGAPAWDGSFPQFVVEPLSPAKWPQLTASKPLMTLAAGAAYGAAKRWPSEYFRAVAEMWIGRGGQIAVLGSGKEVKIGGEIVEGLPAGAAWNLAGRTSFGELVGWLRRSKCCVANDSGVMHLAAALGVSGVAVFGPTDYLATGPVSDHWGLLFEGIDCAPCFKRECPNGSARCIREITPRQVIEAVDTMIGDR